MKTAQGFETTAFLLFFQKERNLRFPLPVNSKSDLPVLLFLHTAVLLGVTAFIVPSFLFFGALTSCQTAGGLCRIPRCLLHYFFYSLAASQGMWVLSSQLRTEPAPPALEPSSLNHWTIRKVSQVCFKPEHCNNSPQQLIPHNVSVREGRVRVSVGCLALLLTGQPRGSDLTPLNLSLFICIMGRAWCHSPPRYQRDKPRSSKKS